MSPRDQRSERSVGGGGKYHRDGEKMLEAKTSHLLEKAGKRFFKWLLYVQIFMINFWVYNLRLQQ